MKSTSITFTSTFAKLALSFIVASSVFAGSLNQKAYANIDLNAAAQSGTHEMALACDNCNDDEPDDTDIEEILKFIDEADDAVVRPTPHGQG